jgi:hypothetical protein
MNEDGQNMDIPDNYIFIDESLTTETGKWK